MEQRWLGFLEIAGLRNLRQVALSPGPGINLIFGANGSGKTSLLEAIHLLAVGRSFLSTQASAFICHGGSKATVFGRVRIGDQEIRVGIEKDLKGGTEVRVDGSKVTGSATVAALLPVILITPESHTLIGGGPGERRALLDWGLFHVEQSFLPLWRRYQRLLKQRNAALANRAPIAPWNEPLASAGEALSEYRRSYVEALRPGLAQALSTLAPELPPVTLDYLAGWSADDSLAAALAAGEERDRRDGFTHSGPHRAELRIRLEGRRAAEVLSRGQEKLVLSALRLAQLVHLREVGQKNAIVLVDDLPAELDWGHRRTFLDLLSALEIQVFVTATERELIDFPSGSAPRLFHVEHGDVRAVV